MRDRHSRPSWFSHADSHAAFTGCPTSMVISVCAVAVVYAVGAGTGAPLLPLHWSCWLRPSRQRPWLPHSRRRRGRRRAPTASRTAPRPQSTVVAGNVRCAAPARRVWPPGTAGAACARARSASPRRRFRRRHRLPRYVCHDERCPALLRTFALNDTVFCVVRSLCAPVWTPALGRVGRGSGRCGAGWGIAKPSPRC